MSYNVKTLDSFERQAKRLIRKYPSLKAELQKLIDTLSDYPTTGEPLGLKCYKIRLKIASARKGKSGGARVITHFVYADNRVFLLSIYSKSEQNTVTERELEAMLKQIP